MYGRTWSRFKSQLHSLNYLWVNRVVISKVLSTGNWATTTYPFWFQPSKYRTRSPPQRNKSLLGIQVFGPNWDETATHTGWRSSTYGGGIGFQFFGCNSSVIDAHVKLDEDGFNLKSIKSFSMSLEVQELLKWHMEGQQLTEWYEEINPLQLVRFSWGSHVGSGNPFHFTK